MPMPKPLARPTRLHIWLRAVRATSLTVTVIPVLLGGGLALIDRGFDGWTFLITMITALLLQAGTHLLNDAFDYRTGLDTVPSPFRVKAIQMGWLSERQVFIGGLVCYILAILLGSYLVYLGGLLILVLGLVGLTAGYLFTATRFALAYNALGELTLFLLMGPLMVLGTYYVMVGIVYLHVILTALPFGLLSAATLYTQNLRDCEQDLRFGKRTLATLLKAQRRKQMQNGLLSLAYLTLILPYVFHFAPIQSLLPLLTLPLMIYIRRKAAMSHDPMEVNVVLGFLILLQLLFGLLHVLGLFWYYINVA